MKPTLTILSLGLATSLFAGPLQTDHVSADAKWLLHVDVDAFRKTQLGAVAQKEIVEKHVQKAGEEAQFDFAKLIGTLHSITAFGTRFEPGDDPTGVALIMTEPDTVKALEGFAAAQLLNQPEGDLQKLSHAAGALYSLKDELFVLPMEGGRLLVGKSRASLDDAHKVLGGGGAALNSANKFSGYPDVADSFFFLAVAEGFSQNANVPPQARILQMTDGARLVLGEKGSSIFLNLALKTRNAEVTSQVKQVIEGMKALVALGGQENPDLNRLVNSAKVSDSDRLVTLSLEYPVAGVIEKIEKKTHEEHHDQGDSGSGEK
ncbi:MAG TPA: hypothetical protein VMS21_15320 [Methylomirabilota bacterium]|nr:hypothetical protein [Methylomirabilota bacterium]